MKTTRYTTVDLVNYGDCEDATYPPQIDGYVLDGPWSIERSTDQAYTGTYSYKLTKTSGAATAGNYYLVADLNTTSGLHEFLPGVTYTFSGAIYLPTGVSSVVVQPSLIQLAGTVQQSIATLVATYDDWQEFSCMMSFLGPTFGAAKIYLHTTIAEAAVIYLDDLSVTGQIVSTQDGDYDDHSSDEKYDFEEAGKVDGRYTKFNIRMYTEAEIIAGTTGSAYGSVITTNAMIRPEYVTRGGASFSKWGICSVCDQTFKESDMVKIKGKWYCVPNKDYLDAE